MNARPCEPILLIKAKAIPPGFRITQEQLGKHGGTFLGNFLDQIIMTPSSGELLVVALGGNALFRRGEKGTFDEQSKNIVSASHHLANLVEEGYRLVITHGNGPQVGATILRHEAGKKEYDIPPLPMHVAVAETQGFIGYLIQQSLRSELKRRRIERNVVTLITRVIVDKNDPELKNPTKPIGPFLAPEEVSMAKKSHPEYTFFEDKSRGGWRRVVPSPDPIRIAIAEQSSIRKLLDEKCIVVACGGGGIPIIEEDGWRAQGIEAVIDKDLAGQRLATLIQARKYVMLTDVDGAYLNFGSQNQKRIESITVGEVRGYFEQGYFAEGSMAPKILAAIRFVEAGGKEAIIAELSEIMEAVSGRKGTHVRPS